MNFLGLTRVDHHFPPCHWMITSPWNPLVRITSAGRHGCGETPPLSCTLLLDANLKKDTIKLAETPCVKIKSALNHHFFLVKSTIFGPACRSPMTAARVAELSPGERPGKALNMTICS